MGLAERLQQAEARLTALEEENLHLREALKAQAQAQEALAARAHILTYLLDSIPQSIFWKDRQSIYLGCNVVFARAVGLADPEEIVGKTDFDLSWPREEAETYRADDAEVMATGQPKRHIVEPLQQANGTRLWIDTTKVPLTDADGRVYGVLGVYEDITERKAAEEAIRHERDLAQQYLDIAGVILVVINAQGCVTLINKKGCEVLGAPPEAILGRHWYQTFIPDRLRAEVMCASKRLMAGETAQVEYYENPVLTVDGRERLIAWHNTVLRDDTGRIVGTLSSGEDITDRKAVERAWQLAQFSVDHAGDMIFWLEMETGRFRYANKAASRRLGYSRAELEQMTVFDIDPDFSPERWPEHSEKLRHQGTLLFETHHRAKNGEIYEVEISASFAVFDNVEYNFAFVRDITERKRLQKALQESESLFRLLAETTQALIYIQQGVHVVYINPSAMRLTGYAADELRVMSLFNLIHPEDRMRGERYYQQRVSGEDAPVHYEIRIITKAGAVKWLELSQTLIEWHGESAILGTGYDITERKAAEKALQESESLFRLLAQMTQALIYIHRNSKFIYVNPSTIRLTGFSADELQGKNILELVYPDDREQLLRRSEQLLAGRPVPARYEARILTKSGAVKWLEISGTVVEWQGAPAILGTAYDITERKAAEEALAESRTILELVLNTIPTRVFWKDRTSRFLGCNLPFAQDAGVPSPEAIIGKTDFDMGWREQADLYRADDRMVIESGIARLHYEEPQTGPAGETRWLRTSKIPLRNAEGAIIGILGVYEDITEEKAAKETLQRTNRALRMLSDSNEILIRATEESALLDAVCRCIVEDGGYHLVWVALRGGATGETLQPAACAANQDDECKYVMEHCTYETDFCFPAAEVMRNSEPVVIADLADARIDPWREEAVRHGYRSVVALPLIVHGETLGALSLYMGTATAPDTAELRLLAELADDVAFGIDTLRTRKARRQALEDLRSERAFLATSIELLPLPVFYALPTHRITRMNRAAQEILHTDDEQQWIAVNIHLADTGAPLADSERPSARALRGETVVNAELLLRFPDGREVPTLVSAAPIYLDDQPAAAMVVVQDITRLKEADYAKDQFLMVLSHELKTPLTSIIGWAQMAEDAPELMPEALTVILRNAHAQKTLLERLLILSRILTGRLELARKPTDLWQATLSALHQMQQSADAREITITITPPKEAVSLTGDPHLLAMAVHEVIDNAIKYTPRGGAITIQGRSTQEACELIVGDTGQGISPEQLSRLTRPFSQLQRREEIGGAGIGLALARGIVEAHHGRLTMESPGPGQGTTVTISLPCTAPVE